MLAVEAHRLGVSEGEASREHAQPPQQDSLVSSQQLVTPVDRGLQRLVARQCGATSTDEQAEPVAQSLEDLLDAQDAGADRGELERERQAVEAPTEVGNGGGVG